MKFAVETKSRAPTFALTSMLDVIFLLLCFFQKNIRNRVGNIGYVLAVHVGQHLE